MYHNSLVRACSAGREGAAERMIEFIIFGLAFSLSFGIGWKLGRKHLLEQLLFMGYDKFAEELLKRREGEVDMGWQERTLPDNWKPPDGTHVKSIKLGKGVTKK